MSTTPSMFHELINHAISKTLDYRVIINYDSEQSTLYIISSTMFTEKTVTIDSTIFSFLKGYKKKTITYS